jgi:hypothetical protein
MGRREPGQDTAGIRVRVRTNGLLEIDGKLRQPFGADHLAECLEAQDRVQGAGQSPVVRARRSFSVLVGR